MLIIKTLGIIPTVLFTLMIIFSSKLRGRGYLLTAIVFLMPLLAVFNLGGEAGETMLKSVSIFLNTDGAVGSYACLSILYFYKDNQAEAPDPRRIITKAELREHTDRELFQLKKPKKDYYDADAYNAITARYQREEALAKLAEEEREAKLKSFSKKVTTPKKKVTIPTKVVYSLPPVSILEEKKETTLNIDSAYFNSKGEDLIKSYSTFGVTASLVDYIVGPTVTTYRIQPETGTRYNKMIGLQREIMGALKASSIRTVAPIAGTSYVGIEVPNAKPLPVHFRNMLNKFPTKATSTTVALGKSNSGDYIFCDLAKMPHILVAGTTGSGKSVALQGMITSLLMRNTPETLQLALIDPKQAEFSAYENLPHLYSPVVYTDIDEARTLVRSLVDEMERRNAIFRKAGVKNLGDYNKSNPVIPHIILFIEEYADLGMADAESSKADGPTISSSLCRIAQKARAAGIHTVLATQRPSADALPPLVRSNFPSAIACKVRGENDSKIILGEVGAESLLGNGDMLYKPTGATSPERLQGVFVSDKDINSIVNYYKEK